MEISKFALPEIIHGRGSLNYAGQCALRLGAKKVFLVSDSGIEEADRLMDDLGLDAIETSVACGLGMVVDTPHPGKARFLCLAGRSAGCSRRSRLFGRTFVPMVIVGGIVFRLRFPAAPPGVLSQG